MHPDQRYIDALRDGDSNVIKEIYDRFAKQAIVWVHANHGTTADARDVFQEAVLVVYEKAVEGKLEMTGSLGALLQVIYRRKWIDKLRQAKRDDKVRLIESERYTQETSPDITELLDVQMEGSTRRRNLANSFTQLSELCQRLLRLLCNGNAPKSVAEQLEMNSVDTLYRRKNACMQRWKELYIQQEQSRK